MNINTNEQDFDPLPGCKVSTNFGTGFIVWAGSYSFGIQLDGGAKMILRRDQIKLLG